MSHCRCIPFALAVLALPWTVLTAQPPRAAPQAPAEPRAPRGVIETGKDGFVLPEGEMTVEELIDAAARFLGRNILWQAQELGTPGIFVFQKRLALDALGCEEMLCELLATRGMALVPIDEQKKVFEVINLQGQRRGEAFSNAVWRTPEEVVRRPNLKQIVLVTVPLQHINASFATNALRPFFANSNSNNALTVGTAGTNESVLLMGFADQVATGIRLLHQCDRPMEQRNPELHEWQQTVQGMQNSITDLQTKLALAQKQIAELQKAAIGAAKPDK